MKRRVVYSTLGCNIPPQYSEVEEDDKVVELASPNEVPEQAPPAYTGEEEETASNPPLTEDVPAPITLDEAPPANAGEEKPTADTTDDAP